MDYKYNLDLILNFISKEAFATKINTLLNINLDEMKDSMELINKAIIVKNETLEKLKDFEEHLGLVKNEYEKIYLVVNQNESLFAKDELLSFLEKETKNNNTNLEERI